MAIPACLWRRTGEIYKANREFAELIGVEGRLLREGQLSIYELMDEEAAVNYWEVSGDCSLLLTSFLLLRLVFEREGRGGRENW